VINALFSSALPIEDLCSNSTLRENLPKGVDLRWPRADQIDISEMSVLGKPFEQAPKVDPKPVAGTGVPRVAIHGGTLAFDKDVGVVNEQIQARRAFGATLLDTRAWNCPKSCHWNVPFAKLAVVLSG
jgi:hypothetical protein